MSPVFIDEKLNFKKLFYEYSDKNKHILKI